MLDHLIDPPCDPVADREADDIADCVDQINAAIGKCDMLDGWLKARIGEHRGHPVIELVDDSELETVRLDWWYDSESAWIEWQHRVQCFVDEKLAPVMEAER